MRLSVAVQIDGEVVEGAGEVRGVGAWVVLGQGPVEVGGFVDGLQGVVRLPVLRLAASEVIEGAGEVGGVGAWVVLGQGPVELGCFSYGFEGLIVSSDIGQAFAK